MSTDPADITPGQHPEAQLDGDPIERAAWLVAASAATGGRDVSELEGELNSVLEHIDAHRIQLRRLLAALAGLGGLAAGEVARLRGAPFVSPEAEDAERSAFLQDCVAVLRQARPQEEPLPVVEERVPEPLSDRRSGFERRGPDRRQHSDESPPARVSLWLHGERRSGERRSGVDRRSASDDGG